MANGTIELTMDNILGASFGVYGTIDESNISMLTINYKKTVNIRQYESEVSEVGVTLKMPGSITGAERMLCLAIMQAQAEYQVYCTLVYKEQITIPEFDKRKAELVKAVQSLIIKAEAITGKSMEHIIKYKKSE